jgi:hypothetical protein
MRPESPEGLAYRKMAHFYRPALPSDGMGTITAPVDEWNLREEIEIYEREWKLERMEHFIGCASFEDRPALVWIVEAARNLCGMNHDVAVRLLRMALQDIEHRAS